MEGSSFEVWLIFLTSWSYLVTPWRRNMHTYSKLPGWMFPLVEGSVLFSQAFDFADSFVFQLSVIPWPHPSRWRLSMAGKRYKGNMSHHVWPLPLCNKRKISQAASIFTGSADRGRWEWRRDSWLDRRPARKWYGTSSDASELVMILIGACANVHTKLKGPSVIYPENPSEFPIRIFLPFLRLASLSKLSKFQYLYGI